MSSILSRVVQLQVAPRGLREANAVKVERAKANNLDNTSSERSHVALPPLSHFVTAPLGQGRNSESRLASIVKVERAKMKDER